MKMIYKLFKNKKEEIFDYNTLIYQSNFINKKRHLLSEKELYKYFISRIDKKRYRICLECNVGYGKYIDDYNWEVSIYKLITDSKGRIKKEYWSSDNEVLVNSKYMNEHELYKSLYNLIKDSNER